MSKKVYVMPEKHPVSQEYIGSKAWEMIEASKEFKKNREPVIVKTFGGSIEINDKLSFVADDFPQITDYLSKTHGVGNYEIKAKIIETAKPDALFLESFTSERGIFNQLHNVEVGFIIGAKKEHMRPYATKRPIYEFCKISGIPIIPIDSEELMEKAWEVDKKFLSFKGDRKSKEFQDIENEFKKIVKKRSQFMLNEMDKNITELGENKTYAALIGSQHYENLLKIPETERNVEILHINKRLEALGSNIRYNESDY